MFVNKLNSEILEAHSQYWVDSQHFLTTASEKRACVNALCVKIAVLNVMYQSLERVQLKARSHRLREGFA